MYIGVAPLPLFAPMPIGVAGLYKKLTRKVRFEARNGYNKGNK